MTPEEKGKVVGLIKKYCYHTTPNAVNYRLTSYDLKELFEMLGECYIAHEEFKECMVEAGFNPTNKRCILKDYKMRVKKLPEIPVYFRGKGGGYEKGLIREGKDG